MFYAIDCQHDCRLNVLIFNNIMFQQNIVSSDFAICSRNMADDNEAGLLAVAETTGLFASQFLKVWIWISSINTHGTMDRVRIPSDGIVQKYCG